MNKTFLFRLFASVICLLSCHNAFAQVEGQPEFSCQIRVSPEAIVSCEPLRLDVKVEYQGTTPRKALLPSSAISLVALQIEQKHLREKLSKSLLPIWLWTHLHMRCRSLP